MGYRDTESAPFTETENWTFAAAGSYLRCAWLRDDDQPGDPVVATTNATLTVRIPKLSMLIAAPPSAPVGKVFQVSVTTQAETERTQ